MASILAEKNGPRASRVHSRMRERVSLRRDPEKILAVRQSPQHLAQQPPEPLHRSDLPPLVRRMGALDDGPEGDHVHAGELLSQDSAFEAGVDGFQLGVGAELLLMELAEGGEEGGGEVRLPTGVAVVLLNVGSREL